MKRKYIIPVILLIYFLLMNTFRLSNKLLITEKNLSSTDKIFRDSGWGGFQLGIIHFKEMNFKEWEKKMKGIKKSFDNYKDLNSVLESTRIGLSKLCETYLNEKPKHSQTFIIILYEIERSVVFIANHSLCDGSKLYDILSIILDFSKELKVPKYFRIPVLSEIMVTSYVFRSFFSKFNYTPIKVEDKNRRFSIQIPLEGRRRFGAYAKVFSILYKVLDESVTNLRIAFTVAWDDSNTKSNNRIGCIILDIPRLLDEDEYKSLIERGFKKRKYDSLLSYELVKNYNVPRFRRMFCKSIDGVFTGLLFPNHVPGFSHCFGGFCGNLVSPFYINAMTCPQEPEAIIQLSIQTCTPLFSSEKFLKLPKSFSYNDLEFPEK